MEGWSVVAAFGDVISAQALLGLLQSEDLPCRLISNAPVPGLGTEFAVLVPTQLQHRARWIRAQHHVSEQELTSLAMSTPSEPEPQ